MNYYTIKWLFYLAYILSLPSVLIESAFFHVKNIAFYLNIVSVFEKSNLVF